MALRFTVTRNASWSLWNIRFMAKPSKRALVMTTDSCPSSPSRIERLFAGEITWTLLQHGRRSLANESRRTSVFFAARLDTVVNGRTRNRPKPTLGAKEMFYAQRYSARRGGSHSCGDHCYRLFLPCSS